MIFDTTNFISAGANFISDATDFISEVSEIIFEGTETVSEGSETIFEGADFAFEGAEMISEPSDTGKRGYGNKICTLRNSGSGTVSSISKVTITQKNRIATMQPGSKTIYQNQL